MTKQKIGVLLIHGIGVPNPHFADGMIEELRDGDKIVFEPVLWAPVLQGRENKLWDRLKEANPLGFHTLRRFMIDFAADALAYQPTPHDRGIYKGIHRIVAQSIKALAEKAGPNAPLCIVAHSLGSVIASNYLYDLQMIPHKRLITDPVRRAMGRTPIDKGETLAGLYTLGSPLALWSLRYDNFGVPIAVPSPRLKRHYPKMRGEWINFYDSSDIIGYPLKSVNAAYGRAVTTDLSVNVGNVLTSWNPASHVEYWTDNDVTHPISESLSRIWKAANR